MSDTSLSVRDNPDRYANPFPGLRPFNEKESDLFFGREEPSRSVLQSLKSNSFVAVTGASGSGKSSLIYCGVVPLLQEEGSDAWHVVGIRPGANPLHNLVSAMSHAFRVDFDHQDAERLEEGQSGAVSMFREKKLTGKPVVIIIDQFEEIFRFTSDDDDQHSAERVRFIEFIFEAISASDLKVRVLLTMRSDFIGECSAYQDLTALINRSNYLIPQMTREDFRRAIEGPVHLRGVQIEDGLVEQLLDEVGENTDQLPVLQHALMRTWDYWLLQKDPEKPISTGDYEAIGRMDKALSDHANEAYDELDERQRGICESMFKTLTDKGGDNRGVRRPTLVSRVAEIAQCSAGEVIEVAGVFRSSGRTFITPYQPVEVTPGTVIDISHESLMRIWDRLRFWVDEEAASVQMYRRLSEAARMFQEGKTGLWRPPDLQLALNWREKQKPTLAWAMQYDPAFERAMVYLETSDREYRKEEENKIRLQRRRLRVTRIFALVLGFIAIIALGLFLWTRDLRIDEERQRELAEQKSAEAERQRQAAEESAENARLQQRIAEEASRQEEQQRKEAEAASRLAEQRRIEAEENLQMALEQERIARENLELANEREREANEQRRQAEEARKEAFTRRMLSIAKSMAVKSQQIDDDPDLKGLLAYQAFLFNNEYGGPLHDVDIYSGLYEANKTLRGEKYNVYAGHNQTVRSIRFASQDDRFYSAGSDGQILRWSLSDTGKSYETLYNRSMVIEALALGQNDRWLAAGTDGQGILLFDLDSGQEEPRVMNGHNGIIRDVEIHSEGEVVYSIGLDQTIMAWRTGGGSPSVLARSGNRYSDIAVSPDGRYLAASDRSGTIHIYPANGSGDTLHLEGHVINPVFSLDFSEDGQYLAAGDMGGNVRLYRTGTWEEEARLRGNDARVKEVRFSPDSKYLASTGYDGRVLMWKMADLNSSPIVMEDNRGFVFTVDFSPDSRYLVSGSSEASRLVARPVRADLLVDKICSLLGRNFTREEWEIYVGPDITYRETCPTNENENQ